MMAGVDSPTVKELMNHKDITMTLRHTHLSGKYKQCAVRRLDGLWIKSQQFLQ